MPQSDYDFQTFNLIRRIARELFVNGYHSYNEFIDLDSKKIDINSRVERVFNCLNEYLSWDVDDKQWMTVKELRTQSNPLYYLFKSRTMRKQSYYALYFALLDMLSNGASLSLAEISDKIDYNVLTDEMSWFSDYSRSRII